MMSYEDLYFALCRHYQVSPPTVGYCEMHHIKPRHAGGDDHADNLVKLRYVDHVRAHLLYAKWQTAAGLDSTGAWAAVHMMAGNHKNKASSNIDIETIAALKENAIENDPAREFAENTREWKACQRAIRFEQLVDRFRTALSYIASDIRKAKTNYHLFLKGGRVVDGWGHYMTIAKNISEEDFVYLSQNYTNAYRYAVEILEKVVATAAKHNYHFDQTLLLAFTAYPEPTFYGVTMSRPSQVICEPPEKPAGRIEASRQTTISPAYFRDVVLERSDSKKSWATPRKSTSLSFDERMAAADARLAKLLG